MSFSKYGPEYAERLLKFHKRPHGVILRDEVSRIVREAKLPRDSRVLEMGCGTGQFCHRIGMENPGFQVLGYDPNLLSWLPFLPPELPGVKYTVDPECLQGGYDMVLCTNVLGHMENPLSSLREMFSRMKPGGLVGTDCAIEGL